MKVYSSEHIRNVALLSHPAAGKTTLAEAMLFDSGAISRIGRVEDGTTISDFDQDEIEHKISLSATLLPIEWRDTKLNTLDTPGYADFAGEVFEALSVTDSAVLVVCGASGVEVGTEESWKRAHTRHIPVAFFVNKLDREHGDFLRTVEQLQKRISPHVVAIQLPIGHESTFRGVVDLLTGVAYYRDGKTTVRTEPPIELQSQIALHREHLVEVLAECDELLTDKFLNGDMLTIEELHEAMRTGMRNGLVLPVLCGSALANIGVTPLLDFIVEILPDPLHTVTAESIPVGHAAAFVFKTVADPFGKLSLFRILGDKICSESHLYNVNRQHEERLAHLMIVRGKHHEEIAELHVGDLGAVMKLTDTHTGDTLTLREHQVRLAPIPFPEPSYSASIEPKTRADLDKLGNAMTRLILEDPTIHWHRDPETAETLISGLGESHVRVAVERLHRKFSTDVVLGEPKVPYRETIQGSAKAQGRHKRQTGGHGQFGDVWLEVAPLERGSGYHFVDRIVGGVVPRQYIQAVDKGIQEVLSVGPLTGSPMVDIQVTLYDGSYHPVDSSEMAFKTAAAIGFRAAVQRANPVLLEPIMDVEVLAPAEMLGDVVGDLNSHRARILGMDSVDETAVRISAHVPMAEMFRYATTLRSVTQGRGSYSMHLLGYEEALPLVAHQVAAAYQKAREAKEH